MQFAEAEVLDGVLASLVAELENGIEMVAAIDDRAYARRVGSASSIGAHIRHDLDFVNALLNGIAERRIDYNARPRNPRVENDREYAIEQLRLSCRRLLSLTAEMLTRLVVVRSEIDEDIWHTSSISRELEFLHSHTVHHYALIAGMIADAGYSAGAAFGVAPSTKRFRAESYCPEGHNDHAVG